MELLAKNSAIISELKVGWYAFAGGRFSPNPKDYRNLQGVVAWLNPDKDAPKGKKGLIVTPDQVRRLWADGACDTRIQGETDGRSNTHELLSYGRVHKVLLPAVDWCAHYCKNGVKAGEGFVPAKNQLMKIVDNVEVVNEALEKIGGDKLCDFIWSSTEYNPYYVWVVKAENGQQYTNLKHYSHTAVRCVLVF